MKPIQLILLVNLFATIVTGKSIVIPLNGGTHHPSSKHPVVGDPFSEGLELSNTTQLYMDLKWGADNLGLKTMISTNNHSCFVLSTNIQDEVNGTLYDKDKSSSFR